MKSSNIIKNISYSFLANVVSLILGILATFLFPKFLNVAGYGYYQLYIFYTGYLIITALGLSDGVQLKIAGKKYSELDFDKQNSLFWFSTLTQIIIYSALIIFSIIFVNESDKRFSLVSVCVVGLVTHPRYYLYTLLQGVNRLKEYAHIIITERSISIVISVIALFLGFKDFRIMIILDIIGRILSFILAMYFCKEIVFSKPKIRSDTVRSAFGYIMSGSMILFSTQASSIIIGINRFGIERQWGIEEFGKISIAIALSNMILRCVNSISVVMFPTLRGIDNKKLPVIYQNINVALTSLVFVMMCFFKPLCYIIGLWLPKYADSLKYSILLLPICIYECKYSLLINTNLKNLNKEKVIGAINAVSVIVSFITALVGITLLKNMEIAIIGIIISLGIRSIIGEKIIYEIFSIDVTKDVVSEFLLSIIFILTNYYCSSWYYNFIFVAGVILFLALEKNELVSLVCLIRKKKTKISYSSQE